MSFLDVRTVMFSHVLTDAVCAAVLAFLWVQNRKRITGLSYWTLDFVFQTAAVVLVVLRGSVPGWLSVSAPNTLVIAGAFLGLLGLTRFVEKPALRVPNFVLLGAFLAVNLYFVFLRPDLAARNLNVSVGLLVVCVQCAWHALRPAEKAMRRSTLPVALVFGVFCLVSMVRIVATLITAPANNDFFRSDVYDTLLLMSYQMLLILLTFALALMVNQRLLNEILTQEEKFTKAFRSSPYAVTLTRPSDGRILEVNDGFVSFSGYTYDESVGKSTRELQLWVSEMDRASILGELKRGNRVMERETQFRKKNGELAIVLFSAEIITINGEPCMLSSTSDITERRKAEESLAVSEANLLSLLASTDDIIVSRDREGRVIAFNKAFASIMRNFFGAEARPGIRVSDFMTAEQKAQWEAVEAKAMSGEAQRHEFSWEFGGSTHYYELALTPIRVGAEIVGTAEFTREITARKRAEAERERLMAAIEQTREMVVVTDPEGSIQYVNPAFETVTGFSRGEAVGRNPRLLKSGVQDESYYQELWRTISSGRTWQGRIVNTRKDGTHYTEDATISPVSDGEGRIVSYVAVKRDISAQRLIEDKLLQAQKMETVGQLAGGVAHDFNNMLQVIISYVEMSLAKVEKGQPLFQNLMQIQRAAQRSAEITGQLLAFARKQTVSPKVLDLNESVAGTQKMIQRLIGEEIDLVWMPGRELWKVKIDPMQLDQILANLAVNARDAIGGVGKVVIGTQKVSFDEAYCAAHAGALPGDYVRLEVSDNGRGMDRETMSHLFEPFFTTKEQGKGTGLGLATIYGIVKQNNGFIDVSSEQGQGTVFSVYLPRMEGETLPGQEEAAASRRGTETVLVVEDEPAILELTDQSLKGLGYTVLTAGSPQEAVRKSHEQPGPIHLLITDVVMPQMNGRQLAELLSAASPGLKCLFMSGYTADVIAHRGVLDEGVSFIAKPFSLITLAEKVREVLDG